MSSAEPFSPKVAVKRPPSMEPDRVDVVLVKLESITTPPRVAPPFGILYVASALEKAGFSVRLIHRNGTRAAIEEIVRDIIDAKPLLAGFSVLSGPSLLPTRTVSLELKKRSSVPVVWGGLHATMLPEQTLREPAIDHVVVGEGEETLVELARSLAGAAGARPLAEIEGLAWKKDGEVRVNPVRAFIKDLDAYAPAWHLLPVESYLYRRRFYLSDFGSDLPGLIAPYTSSRGCPWRCGYCYNQFVNKRSFRAHSAARVISDIECLKREHGVEAVVFEDDNLFTDRNRALEIVRGIGIPWSASLRADYFGRWKEEFIRELKAAGCVELRIGAESGVPRVLEIMAKDVTVEDIRLSAEISRRQGINALYNFMVGIPGETWPEMLQTLDLMDELQRGGGGAVVNGPSVFYPYPGTPLYEVAVGMGFKVPDTLEGWATGWGPKQTLVPFVDKRAKHLSYYRSMAYRKEFSGLKPAVLARPLAAGVRWRWKKRLFRFPLDYIVPKAALNLLRRMGIGNGGRAWAEET
jgi:anaerobic magnesium-protoporphyrin IX monomethyl ester cyclase